MRITHIFFTLSTILYMVFLPFIASAQTSSDFTFTPVLIDEKAQPRDILKQTLTITNTSNRKLNLYPSVNDIDPGLGEQGFVSARDGTDRAASLANWIELSRGVVELSPGEEKTIPFVIRVNLNAIAGTYHAYISFYEGSTREAAEQSRALGKMSVNLEVKADVKEVMQLNTFFSDNVFFSGDDVLFNYQLENIGNQNLKPKGEIRIYDRKGKEVASVDVNEEGKSISPDEVSQLASVWSAASGFGRYKAFINVDYGESQKASVQDTVFFWIIPWQQLVGMLVMSVLSIVFLALYFHRKLDARYHAHFALAQASSGTLQPVSAPKTPQKGDDTKKSLFSYFTRTQTRLVAEAEAEAALPPKRTKNELLTALGGTRIQPEKKHVATVQSHSSQTIDLKKAHAPVVVKPQAIHVINLKNDS